MVYNWPRQISYLLFPPRCILCNRPGWGNLDLCSHCRDKLEKNRHACHRCALPLPATAPARSLCGRCCRQAPPWERLQAPWLYRGGIAELIRELKFRQKLAAGRTLGLLLAGHLEEMQELPQLLLPVPLHASQLGERGFNHAAEITRSLSRAIGIPWSSRRLLKARPTAPQHNLGRQARRSNLRHAFQYHGTAELRHVAVVDDVVTTGSTAMEITRTLKKGGVEKISIWALARTPREHA
jgi:ComF family protein